MQLDFPLNPLAGRHTLLRCAQFLALATAFTSTHALANDDTAATDTGSKSKHSSKIQTLEEMVVVGQPLDSLLSNVDLERRQANDLDDIFSGISSVRVGGSVPAAQKIYVRNLGEDTLNIMIDGATQSGVTYHHTGRITLEPELLKQVKVQVGAGEATNGPGALGGAILFETKDPTDLLGRDDFGALLKTSYMSNTEGTKNSATVFGRTGWFSAMGSYVVSDNNNIEDGDGNELTGTESEQELGFIKLMAELSDGHSLRFSHESLTEEGYKLTRPEWAESVRNPLRFLEFQRNTTRLNHQWLAPGNDLVNLDTNIYHTEFDIFREFDNYVSEVDTWGVTISNTSKLVDHSITYGIDYREDEVTAGAKPNTNQYGETSEVLGFFIQDHHQLTTDLLLSYGTRYDHFEVNDKADNTFSDEGFSPNLGFTYNLTPALIVSGGYALAIRGVETNDGFKLFGTTNDPDLEAEKAKNLELSVDYEIGSFVLSAGVHDAVIENAIGNAVPWSRHYENIGDVESDGYTLGFAFHGEKLSAKVNFLHTTAELDGEELTRYAYGYLGTSIGDTLAIDLDYQVLPTLTVGWLGQIVQGIDDLYVESANAAIDKRGYGVHDFYAQWLPEQAEGLALTLTIKNAFDKQYLDHGSVEDFTHIPGYSSIIGAPAAGRDIRVNIAYQF